jgi:hypothetical protein
MSFNNLMKTIDKVENKPIPGVFDISSMLLPTNEVVKNILIMEDNLSKEDAELMVEGFAGNTGKKKSKSEKEIDSLKDEADTKYKGELIKKSVDDNKNSLTDTDTGAPLSSKSPYHKKAKEILLLIKEKVTQFFRKVKELIKEIVSVTVSIVSSIPGAGLMVSPFAFNVPGMITMLMQMIQLISMLASKVADLVGFFKYFKMLPLVLSPANLNKVSSLINTSYGGVSKAFSPLQKSIDKFNKASQSTIKSKTNEEKQGRTITSRLRKIKYINWQINKYTIQRSKVEEDDLDELEDILEQWEVVRLNNRRNAVRRKKVLDSNGKEVNINDLLNLLDELVDDIQQNLPEVSEEDDVIYDVRFSDGRNLFGVTRKEVEDLESTYNIIYSDNVKYSFI